MPTHLHAHLPYIATLMILAIAGCVSSQPKAAPDTRPTRGVLAPLTKPTVTPATQPAYSLSNFAEQTLPAVPAFASASRQTTFRAIQTSIDGAMKDLFKDPNLGQNIAGPMILVYSGMSGGLDEVFTLEVGFPVQLHYAPAEGVQVRRLPAMRCLSVEFQGPVTLIDRAYDKLVPAVAGTKLQRTGEACEIYYRWEGPTAEENLILVAVGVK